jgi:hypothetical protein
MLSVPRLRRGSTVEAKQLEALARRSAGVPLEEEHRRALERRRSKPDSYWLVAE